MRGGRGNQRCNAGQASAQLPAWQGKGVSRQGLHSGNMEGRVGSSSRVEQARAPGSKHAAALALPTPACPPARPPVLYCTKWIGPKSKLYQCASSPPLRRGRAGGREGGVGSVLCEGGQACTLTAWASGAARRITAATAQQGPRRPCPTASQPTRGDVAPCGHAGAPVVGYSALAPRVKHGLVQGEAIAAGGPVTLHVGSG